MEKHRVSGILVCYFFLWQNFNDKVFVRVFFHFFLLRLLVVAKVTYILSLQMIAFAPVLSAVIYKAEDSSVGNAVSPEL